MTAPQPSTLPVSLRPDARRGGLDGANGRYEKTLAELRGLYRDYSIIERAGGMRQLVVAGPNGSGQVRPDPDHRGYRPDRS